MSKPHPDAIEIVGAAVLALSIGFMVFMVWYL
jgi:hypothetical protein